MSDGHTTEPDWETAAKIVTWFRFYGKTFFPEDNTTDLHDGLSQGSSSRDTKTINEAPRAPKVTERKDIKELLDQGAASWASASPDENRAYLSTARFTALLVAVNPQLSHRLQGCIDPTVEWWRGLPDAQRTELVLTAEEARLGDFLTVITQGKDPDQTMRTYETAAKALCWCTLYCGLNLEPPVRSEQEVMTFFDTIEQLAEEWIHMSPSEERDCVNNFPFFQPLISDPHVSRTILDVINSTIDWWNYFHEEEKDWLIGTAHQGRLEDFLTYIELRVRMDELMQRGEKRPSTPLSDYEDRPRKKTKLELQTRNRNVGGLVIYEDVALSDYDDDYEQFSEEEEHSDEESYDSDGEELNHND